MVDTHSWERGREKGGGGREKGEGGRKFPFTFNL
jgi:hypothetical protein